QDLITQIIGESPDSEVDTIISVQRIDANTFIVQAQLALEEVNRALNLDIPSSDEYQTLGGFLLYQWQRIPLEGEITTHSHCEFTILSAVGPRLDHIQVRRLEVAVISDQTIPLDNESAVV
ncbi:MAG: hypothetical protein H7237_09075, partial [Alkalinema sp. FL-bin-369]|nr:hypothetical protein [Leptolyngbyaceae cyanobacterium LF-bin-369]